ncbi:MFS transporter [Cryobacterium tepidiphilum]|uniref:MFS transporter n=1 Tax=Cryobacterium tepidiphilum TaxID=2486026 RepID=A0A3M8LBE0_9MICO|nr:MFS transporter [Cryobacterium tepidiphilum]RNE62645.1 MFS transporter [Cryobacterium tepidiphilum]
MRAAASADTAEPVRAGRRQWAALAVLMLPVVLVSVDNTVLNFALPAISKALEPSGVALLWIIDVYPLVLAALLVTMGALADRIGRRRLLLIGSVGFVGLSVLAAFAPTAGMLILTRAALGFFGAMLMPSTLSLLRSIFVNRDQRRMAIAIWAAGFAAGSALGPIVGGLLLAHFWWGSVFLIAVPVLVPLLVLVPILIPESRDPRPGPVDLPSIVLSLLALGSLVYGIKSLAGAATPLVGAVAVVIGVIAGALFVRRQLRRSIPMLDVRLFGRPAFTGAVLVNLLSVIALVGGLFFVSQHLQLVLGQAPVAAALALLPGLVAMIIAGLVVVPIARRVRPGIVVPVGLMLSAAGYAMIAVLGQRLSVEAFIVAFVALGVGIGAAETVSNELIIATAPPDKAGAASAVSETAYELGAVLGTAILGTIITASYRAAVVLPAGLTTRQEAAAGETIGGAAAVAESLPGAKAEALMASARYAFDSGVALTAGIGAGLVLLAAVVAAVMLRHERSHG